MEGLLWKRTVFSAAVGPVAVLLGKSKTKLLASEAAREIARLCFYEILAVLRAKAGITVEAEQLEKEFLDFLKNTAFREPTKASVSLGPILKDAKRLKIQTPVLEKIHAMTKAYEKKS